MKNKITKKVLIILLLIIQILQITGNMFSTVQASIKEGDTIEISFGNKEVKVEVLNVQETVKKDEAKELYRYL